MSAQTRSDDNLRDSFYTLVEKSVGILSNYFGEYVPPYKNAKYERFFKTKTHFTRTAFYLDFFENLVSEKRSEIESTQEFMDFTSLTASDRISAKNMESDIFLWGSNFGNALTRFYEILQEIIAKYYETNSYGDVQSLYAKFENFLYSDYIDIQVLAPVFNVRLDNDHELDLTNFFQIRGKAILRKITDSEKSWLMNEVGLDPFSHAFLDNSHSILDLQYQEKKYFGIPNQGLSIDIQSNIENFIYALQLMQSIFVGVNLISFKPVIGKLKRRLSYDYNFRDLYSKKRPIIKNIDGTVTFKQIPVHMIKETDLSEVFEVYQSLPYRTKNRNIKLAFDRFLISYERKSREDKFIDLCVAVEALFSRDEDIIGSLTYKYSLRLSRFLNEDPEERQKDYIVMSGLYGQRSKIIHAKNIKQANVEKLKGYVSKSLIRYLRKLKDDPDISHDRLIKEIDFGNNSI